MSFGPVNGEGGERRLNVLFTRARLRCEVFASSIPATSTSAGPRGEGPRILKRFLEYAEIRRARSSPPPTGEPADSPFEEDVAEVIAQPRLSSPTRRSARRASASTSASATRTGPARTCSRSSATARPTIRRSGRGSATGCARMCWSISAGASTGSGAPTGSTGAPRPSTPCAGCSPRHWSPPTRASNHRRQRWPDHRVRRTARQAVTATPVAAAPALTLDVAPGAATESVAPQPAMNQNGPTTVRPGPAGPASPGSAPIRRRDRDRDRRADATGTALPAGRTARSAGEPHLVPTPALARLAAAIVDVEGPVHVDEIARRVATGFGRDRAGTRIVAATRLALAHSGAPPDCSPTATASGTPRPGRRPTGPGQVRERNQPEGGVPVDAGDRRGAGAGPARQRGRHRRGPGPRRRSTCSATGGWDRS